LNTCFYKTTTTVSIRCCFNFLFFYLPLLLLFFSSSSSFAFFPLAISIVAAWSFHPRSPSLLLISRGSWLPQASSAPPTHLTNHKSAPVPAPLSHRFFSRFPSRCAATTVPSTHTLLLLKQPLPTVFFPRFLNPHSLTHSLTHSHLSHQTSLAKSPPVFDQISRSEYRKLDVFITLIIPIHHLLSFILPSSSLARIVAYSLQVDRIPHI